MIVRKLTILAGMAAAALAVTPAKAETLRLMTGPQGGVWVPLGGTLKDLWEKQMPGVSVQSLPGAGIANVRGVEEGKAEIGFGNSISTVDAILGNEPFKAKHTECVQPRHPLSAVFPGGGAGRFRHQVAQGPQGQDDHHAAARQHGRDDHSAPAQGERAVNYNDMKVSFVSYTDAVSQMQDGHAQAFFLGTTIPSGAVMDLASARNITVVDMAADLDEMKKINPGYTLETIKAGTYPKQDKEVKVIGYATHLVASCKLPEDRIYGMVKAMATNIPGMVAVVKAIDGLTVKAMAADIGVPFHPGAKKYYREAGLNMM